MNIILPSEISSSEISNIEQFTKKYEIRVKLFRGEAGEVYDSSYNEYSSSTGIYGTMAERLWLKQFTFQITSGYDVIRVEYKDYEGNWIQCYTSVHGGTTTHVLKNPIYSTDFRFTEYKQSDPTDTDNPAIVILYSEKWHDITKYVTDEILIENNVGDMIGNFKLPFTSIALNNDNGRWNKLNQFNLYSYSHTYSDINKKSGSQSSVIKKAGIRCVVEIQFYGDLWQPSKWILLSSFYVRRFTTESISGESAWIAKTLYQTPVIEGVSAKDIIIKYISKKSNESILQVTDNFKDETISIVKEVVGTAELEPTVPNKIIDTKKVYCHCDDGTYLYYALKDITGVNTQAGGFIEVRRMLMDGSEDVSIGKIYAIPQDYYTIGGTPYDCSGVYYTGQHVSLNNNNAVRRMIRGVYGMACDGAYIYISVLSISKGIYYDRPTSIIEQDIWQAESCIYKLPATGNGWYAVCGSSVKETAGSHTVEVPPSSTYTTAHKFSLGFFSSAMAPPNGINPDPYDIFSDPGYTLYVPIIRNLILYDDNGTEKLMFIKEKQRQGDQSYNMSEYWIINKDFTSPTNYGNEGYLTRIESICQISGVNMYVHYTIFTSGGSESSKKIGIISRDPATSNFFIRDFGDASLTKRFYSMSFIDDSIYISGVGYDSNTAYSPNVENAETVGIKQLYKCVFQLDAFNIIYFDHPTRNQYLSYPVPELYFETEERNAQSARYADYKLDGEILSTPVYVMDLYSGLTTLRQPVPSGSPVDLIANYDFKRSYSFYIGKSPSRLGPDGITKITQSSGDNAYIDESGALSKLDFIESQEIGIGYTAYEYGAVSEDNGEQAETSSLIGIRMSQSSGNDRLISFQFTPEFDGYLEGLKLPIKIIDQSGAGSLNPTYDVQKSFQCYITNGGINYATSDGVNPTTPPTSSQIQEMLDTYIYVSYSRLNATTNESPVVWFYFDFSLASKQVTAGVKYGIILRTDNTGDLFNYFTIGKKVSNSNNRAIFASIADGSDITTMSSSAWGVLYTSNPSVMYNYVVIQKKKQELKSTNIVDSLNPSISSGFTSVMGGSNSTIAVYSQDFSIKYVKSTDYNITYSGGKFYIEFIGSLADSRKNIVILWMNSKIDLLTIADSGRGNNLLFQSSEYGDSSTYLKVEVDGKRVLPATFNVKTDQIFTMTPGVTKGIEASSEQSTQIESAKVLQWDDSTKQYVEGDSGNQLFAFDFKDPFMTGTTGYEVEIGLGKSTDIIDSGAKARGSSEDVPLFYEVSITGFSDANYTVMLKQEQYREWRIATVDDYADMTSDTVNGTPPSSSTDIKTSSHFYLKHMNNAFGWNSCSWVAYYTEKIKYYINEDGEVIRDDTYSASDENKNPIKTSYPSKRISVLVSATDFAGCPLFPAHSEASKDGYDSGYASDVKQWMSGKVDRVDINPNGVNAIYTNFDPDIHKFLHLTIIGYPLNNIITIKEERRKDGYDHADAKSLTISNDLIQVRAIAARIAGIAMTFWGQERINFIKDIVYDPRYRPGTIVRVTSELEGLSDNLFYITSTRTLLSTDGGFKTTLGRFLQI